MGWRGAGLTVIVAIAAGATVALAGPGSSAPILVGVAVLAAGYLGARMQRATRRIDRKLDQLAKHQALQGKAIKRIGGRTDRLLRMPTTHEVRELSAQDFRQVEALLNLHAIVRVGYALPPTRGWAASPDLLLLLTSLVASERPATVVDLGSGSSTLWLGLAMRTYGVPGRIIAIDHDEGFARSTRALIERHGLGEYAEVRHAPLVEIKLGQEAWPWYSLAALADVQRCDLLVVDGPPGTTREHARYPALPVLAPKLSEAAVVVLDDYNRPEEQEIVRRWLAEFPGWASRTYPHEEVTVVLSRRAEPLD